MKTPPAPPAAESAQWTHESERVYLDGVCVAVSQHKADTIAQGMSAHAAAQQRIGELEKALNDALPLLALLAGKNDTMAEAAWQHGLAALRHPERT